MPGQMKRAAELPSVAELRAALTYNPDTGRLAWRATGRTAGCMLHARKGGVLQDRYRFVGWRNSKLLGHRLAYALRTGSWPRHPIRLRDGSGLNLRWDNLVLHPEDERIAARAVVQEAA